MLALIGIGIGVAAIWLQMDTETHLAWMETKLAAAAGPSRAEREARNERLQMLEQRLQQDISALSASLEQRVGHQDDRLDRNLEGLQSALLEVHGHLEEVQSQLAEVLKHPVRAQQGLVKNTATPASSGSDMASKEGAWVVNLISFRTRAKADTWVARLRDDGIQASVLSADLEGRTWYRVVVGGFANFGQAKAFAKEIRSQPDLNSAWVGRNRGS